MSEKVAVRNVRLCEKDCLCLYVCPTGASDTENSVIDTEKCIGCSSCMRIGCPAISMKDGKAHVDNTLCVGCGVCAQLCSKDAFESTQKEG